MKNFLLTISFMCALIISAAAQQDTLVDFETVQDPLVEPFDLGSYESAVADPEDATNHVAKVVKGWQFWGGINLFFGGNLDFTGSDDQISVDFYTDAAPANDTLTFTIQLFNRFGLGVETVQVDTFYMTSADPTNNTWKTIDFDLPDTISNNGNYNQMVIFFGWQAVVENDIVYFDNISVPGYTPYGNTDVTFNITDKFNSATNVKLYIDGTEESLTQTDNLYHTTVTLAPYNITVGESQGIYEIVYSYVANDSTINDTTSLVVGNSSGTQETQKLIIVEEPEDGTMTAADVGDTPPTIDGQIGNGEVWENADRHFFQKRDWWGSPTGLYAYFKMMYDTDSVYILTYVEDNTPFNDGASPWENDNVEYFFDMDQSASQGFDNNDWQIRVIRGIADSLSGSANVDAAFEDAVNYAQGSHGGDYPGYIVETAIPWVELSSAFVPLSTSEFNFDIIVADNADAAGGREYLISWNTQADVNYQSTEHYGTVTLGGDSGDDPSGIETPEALKNVRMYPNPAKEVVTLDNMEDVKSVSVSNILGARLKEVPVTNKRMNLNIEEFSSGIYIIIFQDNQGNKKALKLLKE